MRTYGGLPCKRFGELAKPVFCWKILVHLGVWTISEYLLSCLAGNDFANVERWASDLCGWIAVKQPAMKRCNGKSKKQRRACVSLTALCQVVEVRRFGS